MKVFWASLLFFSLILTGTVCNALYIHRTMTKMQQLLEDMDSPAACSESILALEDFWEEKRGRIGLTTGHKRIRLIDEGLIELKWAARGGKENEFQKYRALLIDATQDLVQQESLTLEAIF